jgi:chaperonin cofactor prefoldin
MRNNEKDVPFVPEKKKKQIPSANKALNISLQHDELEKRLEKLEMEIYTMEEKMSSEENVEKLLQLQNDLSLKEAERDDLYKKLEEVM